MKHRGIPGLKVLDGQPVTRKEASLRRACRRSGNRGVLLNPNVVRVQGSDAISEKQESMRIRVTIVIFEKTSTAKVAHISHGRFFVALLRHALKKTKCKEHAWMCYPAEIVEAGNFPPIGTSSHPCIITTLWSNKCSGFLGNTGSSTRSSSAGAEFEATQCMCKTQTPLKYVLTTNAPDFRVLLCLARPISLTLDMLRRNGRTRAPRSGPHRTTVHNGRPAGDGVAFDEGDYRQKPAHSTSNIDSDEQQKQQQQQHQAAASPGGEFDPEACGQEKRHVSTHLRGRTGESRDHYSVSGDMKAEEETNDSTSAGGVVDVGAAGEDGEHHEIQPLGNETGPKPRKPSTAAATGASRGGRTSSNATSSDGRPNSAPATETGAVAPIGALEQGGGDGVVSDDDCTPKGGGLALESIELVNLHNLSLHKLEGMERLTRLRVADLSGNELHDTAPLRSCACLEVIFVLLGGCFVSRSGGCNPPPVGMLCSVPRQ